MIDVTENQVRIAADLYNIRERVRSFLGAEYHAKMRSYETVIRAVASQRDIDELAAATAIVKEANLDGFASLFVLAAAVELVEPTP